MLAPQPLPTLPLTVPIPPLYAHLTRIHPWDDPGWAPKAVGYVRAMGHIHRSDQPTEKEDAR